MPKPAEAPAVQWVALGRTPAVRSPGGSGLSGAAGRASRRAEASTSMQAASWSLRELPLYLLEEGNKGGRPHAGPLSVGGGWPVPASGG